MTLFLSTPNRCDRLPMVLKFGLIAAAAAMAGCATLGGSLSATQCQQSNWQAIGYQDGLMGRGSNYIQKHIKQCAKSTVAPNQQLWQQGRIEGLKRYCTPLRAYQLGLEGYAYNDVCPPSMTLDLLKAHDDGYSNYQREQTLNQLWYNRDPFWREGWNSPFYRPFYPQLAPNSYPNYIDSQSQPSNQAITLSNDASTGAKN